MKEHNKDQKSNNPSDDNLSAENLIGDDNTENSAGQIILERNNASEESNNEDKIQTEQTEKSEESKTPADYDTIIANWKDKYLRLSAEFDNYRKRTLKEKIELTKYANEELLLSLLPVVDDFEHALLTLEQATDMDALKQGIDLIYKKFKDFLAQKGLKEIEALNTEFNTDYHEAITKIPVNEKEKSGKIIDVIQKGYMLDEKVIRHSKVVIGE